MSKLPNAPLQEVIFELRWQITQKSTLGKYQFLLGDLYSQLKKEYPYRETLVPVEIPIELLVNSPAHRFRVGQNQYPLVQVGPGIITLNTTDDNYFWEDFYSKAEVLMNSFFEVYPADSELFTPTLLYLDFFQFNFKTDNVDEFLNRNLKITISQNFLHEKSNPYNLDIGLFYHVDLGNLSVSLKKGKNTKNQDGIVMQMSLKGNSSTVENLQVLDWLNSSHTFLSDLFKDITKGELYNSFK
ncbi:MAG TPA: hypothetical protein DCE78_10445 [Bacteroidetes bacterium]|nr:hypothetical protein [Bacteroidota bacterium]